MFIDQEKRIQRAIGSGGVKKIILVINDQKTLANGTVVTEVLINCTYRDVEAVLIAKSNHIVEDDRPSLKTGELIIRSK